ASRVLPGRSAREPAADGRELDRLRKVSERVAAFAQPCLEDVTVDAGLDGDGERFLVEVERAVESREVEQEAAGDRNRLTADARIARDRRHRHARVAADREDRVDLLRVLGKSGGGSACG